MPGLIELLAGLEVWHWFVFGIMLMVLEIAGAGGFLIGMALAAFFLAALLFVVPALGWPWQLAIFALTSVSVTVLYLKVFRNFNQATDAPLINDRAAQLVGQFITLTEPVHNGEGSVQVGDTRWRVKCEGDLPVGEIVEVADSDGMTLILAEKTRPEGYRL
jgi:membrane protein implicated in regulation of membrane protease activity